MPQTTAALAGSITEIEYSLNASGTTGTWVDISGYAASVNVSGGEQVTGTAMTMDGDAAIVTGSNKTEPFTVEFSIVYTETDAQPFDALWDRFKGATKTAAVRWTYAGSGTGKQQYATTNSAKSNPVMVPIVACTPPNAEANSGDPLLFTFSVITPDILKSTTA